MIDYYMLRIVSSDSNNNIQSQYLPVIKESRPYENTFRYTIIRRIYKKKLTKLIVNNIKGLHCRSLYLNFPEDFVLLTGFWNTDDSFIYHLIKYFGHTDDEDYVMIYKYTIE